MKESRAASAYLENLRTVPTRWAVVNAAVAHIQAIYDRIAYRRGALDDPPAHDGYVVVGAAAGKRRLASSQADFAD